jgi:riboflavin biosynthesis pyrimidine reductase
MPGITSPRFESLFEVPGLPRFDLPAGVERHFGGFGLPPQLVYANFVSSLDGIAAIPGPTKSSAVISRGDPADRFVMALLRASADAVVIGAGTFRAHTGPWIAEKAYPAATEPFIELRRRLGVRPSPTLVVVTASGNVTGSDPSLQDTIVVTTSEAADLLVEDVGDGVEVVSAGTTGSIDFSEVIRMLSERGYRRVLTEGGPRLMGELLQAGVVSELFLTVSPLLVGGGAHEPRPSLAAGADLLSDGPLSARLLSVRRSNEYLFLRYSLLNGDRS